MINNFQIKPLNYDEFANLFDLQNKELEKFGAIRMCVDKKPGFPCRVNLEDAEIGEEVILLPHKHHKTNSPYQASGPIFIRRAAKTAVLEMNEIPKMLNHRFLSVRCYDKKGIMLEAIAIDGQLLREHLNRLLNNQEIDYIHIHNAKPGCFNCRIERFK